MKQTIRSLWMPAAGMLSGVRRVSMLLATLLLTMTAQTAWAENVNLTEDTSEGSSTAARWYVNVPSSGTNTLTLSDASVTTFKVYDDGGKNGNYSNNCKGTLTLTAPTGYVLQLSGSITTEMGNDNLTVYNGSTTSDTKLLDAVFSTSWGEKSITATSTGNSMMLYFKSDGSGNYRGLDLTVTLVSTSEEFGITVNSATGGSVAASVGGNSATKAKVNDVVTLTATPPSGYMVSDIIVKDENNIPVAVSGGWYSNNQATFTMPGSAVTVTPSFTNTWTADGGLYVNMPATGTNTLTIPSGVQSFKVYDDGGAGGSTTNGSAGNYSNNCSGYLTLTAPTGYVLQLSGSITTEKSSDNLTVYNGNTTSATKLLDEVSSSKDRTVTTITTVVSSGQSMMLYFKSDRDVNYTGLDLTVTLVLSSPHSININTASGGTVTASVNNQSVTSARIEDAVTLTATPESGYVLSGISVTDGNSNAVDIDWSIWTNTATFTMPGSEVTVTPTFTNAKTADDGLNINMIETGEQTATIPAGVQSFHVDYDYSINKSATSKLTMTAPEGYLLQLSGMAKLTGTGQAYFRVYDGDNVVNAPILINSSSSGNYSYTGVVSTGNVMTIYCWTSYTNNDRTWDLDVTVNVVNANTSNGVTISNSITNGQVVSDKNTANVNETVTLTATPAEGCVLQSISVTDGNGAISLTPSVTDATWGDVSYYTANEFTFKMRSSDATVTATFIPKTDFYVNMPKTDQRDLTIPDGTTSFKVYDNSGKDGSYFTGNNGKLLLTAPEGYMMNVSGYVKLYYSSDDQDYLDIYDGNSTSATSLGRFKDTSGNNNTFTQTSVSAMSSTNQMLLHFVTNDYGYAPVGGVYLTVTLVPKEYFITYSGVEDATFETANPTTYTIESAAITLNNPSKTGYEFAGWTGTGLDAASTSVTIAKGSTGNKSFAANWTENIATLTEADPITPLTAMSGKQTKVNFTRSGLTAGKYSTICLPFDFTASETCTFYKFDGVKKVGDDWVADISATTGGSANTPYIFTTDATSVTFSNDAVTATDSYSDATAKTSITDWTFQGTYAQISLPNVSEYDYGFAAGSNSDGVNIGDFVHLVSGASAAPFRAYLKYTGSDDNWAKTRGDGDALPSRIIVRIVGANGDATAIGTLDTRTGEISTGDWYSLDGRRLQGKPAKKGLYINNGRKVVIK